MIGPLPGQLVAAVSRDGLGTLYLEQRVGNSDTMYVYSSGSSVSTRSFTIYPHLGPVRFVLDASNHLYMPTGSTNQIDVYDATTGAISSTHASPINDPFAIDIAPDGTTYIAGHSPEVVAVIPSGATAPAETIAISNGTPRAIAVDASDRLFVVTGLTESGNLQVFLSGQTSPVVTIVENGPTGVAVDASQNVYVSVATAIDVYGPAAMAALNAIPTADFPSDIAI
jgi:hypothetical protein